MEWAHLGSNQGPLACEASALPLSYAPLTVWESQSSNLSPSTQGRGLARFGGLHHRAFARLLDERDEKIAEALVSRASAAPDPETRHHSAHGIN